MTGKNPGSGSKPRQRDAVFHPEFRQDLRDWIALTEEPPPTPASLSAKTDTSAEQDVPQRVPPTALIAPTDAQLQAATSAFQALGGKRTNWSHLGKHAFRLTL